LSCEFDEKNNIFQMMPTVSISKPGNVPKLFDINKVVQSHAISLDIFQRKTPINWHFSYQGKLRNFIVGV
jgi:hypothetical protein